jgi:ABC-type transport system substrate-binding protein
MFNPRFLKLTRSLAIPLVLVLVLAMACGTDEAPTPTPINVSAIVQEAISAQPAGVTQDQVAAAIASALAAQSGGVTAADMAQAIQSELGKQPGVTQADVAEAIESALQAQPGISPEDIQKAVESAVAKALPTAEPTPDGMAMMEPKFGGIVPMHGFSAIIPRVHPRGSVASLHGLYGLFSSLVMYDAETPEVNDVVCDLCTSWEVAADGMTHTFNLHKDAFWRDGVKVTARDVFYTLDSIMDTSQYPILVENSVTSSYPEYGWPFYMNVGSYRVVDDFTFEATTKFPTGNLLIGLGGNNSLMVAAHKVLDEGILQGTVDIENLVTSGPFLLESYEREVVWRSRRNPRYYREGYPRVDGIDSFILPDKSAALAAYKTGQVLMGNAAITNLNNDEMKKLVAEEKDLNVYFSGPKLMTGMVFNTLKPPFDNAKARMAVSLAVYRQAIIGSLGGDNLLGGALPPDTTWSRTTEELETMVGYRETAAGEKDPRDIEAAKALLEEAGLGGKQSVQLTTRNCCNYPEVATVVADQLRRFLGWDVDLRILESAAGIDAYAVGDMEFIVQSSGLFLQDPDSWLDRYQSINIFAKWALGAFPRDTGYEVPRYNELFDKQQVEVDVEKRRQIVREMEDIILNEDTIFVPLYWDMGGWLVRSQIQGFNVHPLLFAYMKHDQIWCDPAC